MQVQRDWNYDVTTEELLDLLVDAVERLEGEAVTTPDGEGELTVSSFCDNGGELNIRVNGVDRHFKLELVEVV